MFKSLFVEDILQRNCFILDVAMLSTCVHPQLFLLLSVRTKSEYIKNKYIIHLVLFLTTKVLHTYKIPNTLRLYEHTLLSGMCNYKIHDVLSLTILFPNKTINLFNYGN